MLKNLSKSGTVFFPLTYVRFIHSRIREAFLIKQIENKRLNKPSYNKNYDPESRNVLREFDEVGEDGVLEDMGDEIWRAEQKIFDPHCDEREQRRILKQQIRDRIERKKLGLYVKEPNLLTWAARTQIRFLHAQDPYTWTVDVLADSFPVSKRAIRSVLKSKWLPVDAKEIERFDKKIYLNWLRLKSDLENQTETFRWLDHGKRLDERFSKMINAAGIPSLPVPATDEVILTQEKLVEKLHPKVKGAFSSILSDYKAQFSPVALGTAKTIKSLGHSECNRVKENEKQALSAEAESQSLAIGDKESVKLLSSISSLYRQRKKQEKTEDVAEEYKDEQAGFHPVHPDYKRIPAVNKEKQSDYMRIPAANKENQSKIEMQPETTLPFQSRRQRRLKEVSVNKDTIKDLQMLGTQKVS